MSAASQDRLRPSGFRLPPRPPAFHHGELRLWLLVLLGEGSHHGYELIQELSDRFGGTYAPSAGTIYPRLAKLEADRLVEKRDEGRKTVYTITDAGRSELTERAAEVAALHAGIDASVREVAAGTREGLATAHGELRDEIERIARLAQEAAKRAGSRPDAPHRADSPRDDSPQADSSPADSAPADSAPAATAEAGAVVRDIELTLNRFRHEIREDARDALRAGSLDHDVADYLEVELGRIRDTVGHFLGIHR